MASFRSEYGINLTKDLRQGLKWAEFSALLGGLGPDSPIGRLVSIRAETDPEVLKQFTPSMRKIRAEWIGKAAKNKPEKETADFIESMKNAFIAMAGEVKHSG